MPFKSAPLLALLLFTVPAPAAVFNVADGDVAGLVAAFQTSNTNGEPDVINLATDGSYVFTSTTSVGQALPTLVRGNDVTIHGNGATLARDPNASGFRIIRNQGTLRIDHLTIANGVGSAAGIGSSNNEGDALLVLTNCEFRDNSGGQTAVGVAIRHNSMVEIDSCRFLSNTTVGGGSGGAIASDGGSLTIANSHFEGNSAGSGGAIQTTGELVVSNTKFVDNHATGGRGGAITTVNQTLVNLNQVEFIANSATTWGGALSIRAIGIVTLSDCLIDGNVAQGSNGGGGLNFESGDELIVSRCQITNNTAADSGGGGIRATRPVTLIDSVVADNQALNGSGGGFDGFNNASLTAFNTRITGNTARTDGAASNGGGIALSSGDLALTESTVADNEADQRGGGIYLLFRATDPATLIKSTISGNASGSHGGGIYHRDPNLLLENSTISGNQAASEGGGIYFENGGGSSQIVNTTIAFNSAIDGGQGINNWGPAPLRVSNTLLFNPSGMEIDGRGMPATDLGYNLVRDGSFLTEPTSLTGDPQLEPLADNGGPTLTHALTEDSIAIAAGDCFGGKVTEDQRGLERPQNPGCDIGAFELEYDDTIFADAFEPLG